MSTKPTYAELKLQFEVLQAQLKTAREEKRTTIEFRVGDKGGVSVYGLGRFPVTLYKEQWDRLITAIPQLQEFIMAHSGELKLKAVAVVDAPAA